MTMTEAIVLDGKLTWREVAAVAEGAELTLSPAAWTRVDKGRQIVDALVDKQIRGYGIIPASARSATSSSTETTSRRSRATLF
jgi:histidine ammonia-lyase